MAIENNNAATAFSLLVGYDGSDCAKAAIASLSTAGLPSTGTATVMSVSDSNALACTLGYGYPVINPDDIALRLQVMKECAQSAAVEGATRLQRVLPGWKVSSRVVEASPYWALIEHAERHSVNLIAVGSHGRGAVGRLFMGSTSQFLVTHATCSVRVCRPPSSPHNETQQHPPRLLLALDGSESSDAVVEEVARRCWLAGSRAQLIVAVDVGTAVSIRSRAAREPARIASPLPEGVLERAAAALENSGLEVSGELKEGDPKQVILERAAFWASDVIFIGAQGHSRLSRILLGSVSAAIAARAPSSVEIVRRTPTAAAEAKAATRSTQFSSVGG